MTYTHPVNNVKPTWFDIGRMEKALKSPRHKLPKGLTPEEIRDHILSNRGNS